MSRLACLMGVFATVFAGAAGCSSDSTSAKGLLGSYSVTISAGGKSDNDVLTLVQGARGRLLLLFELGITTDAMGPNPNGLISSLDGMKLTLDRQPAHIDHSTGTLDGTLTGEGMVAPDGSSLVLTLHFSPTNFAFDGGAATDGGAPTLDYDVSGAKM